MKFEVLLDDGLAEEEGEMKIALSICLHLFAESWVGVDILVAEDEGNDVS